MAVDDTNSNNSNNCNNSNTSTNINNSNTSNNNNDNIHNSNNVAADGSAVPFGVSCRGYCIIILILIVVDVSSIIVYNAI